MTELKFKALLTTILITILLIIAFPSKILASTVIFQDNFNNSDTTQGQWSTNGALGWQVINGEYGIHLDPMNESHTYPADNVWNNSWNDYDIQVDLRGQSGVEKSVAFRYIDNLNYYEIYNADTAIYLYKHVNGNISVIASIAKQLHNGQNYHFDIQIKGTHINAKIDGIQVIDFDDTSNPIMTGRVDLHALSFTNLTTEVWYDNLIVTTDDILPTPTPTPIPLPNLNVPDLKQYSSPWSGDIYDQAKTWSSSPTLYIKNWGCALTSADMILQYYGFNLNPGDLNTWLETQPDGYVPNGFVNWLAISRYSKTHVTTNQPSLEFKWLPNTLTNLTTEITNGHPAILVEPNHFVVAKSITTTSFGINDPAYSDRPTLSSYNNSFQSIGTYTPSHTDLSYIMLTINPSFNLKVFDINNNEITGDTFIQNPLVDDVNNSTTSGSPLKIFMFPKPSSGNYKVQVSGNGIYELDSYLYDTVGNVNIQKTQGITSNNQTDEFIETIGLTNSTKQTITIDQLIIEWDNAKTQNQIKKPIIYTTIKAALTLVKDLLNHQSIKLAKLTLIGTIELLKLNTPNCIDESVSKILQSELLVLINSL